MLRGTISTAAFIMAAMICVLPASSSGAVRTSIGVVGGVGIPAGWWGDRWDYFQAGEINLRYEFAPGSGLLLLAGLGKNYYASMSSEEILADSRLGDIRDEFPYTILTADQGGSFKQLPVGFGFYTERMLWRMRAYGSLAMVIYNWKFERSQELEVEVKTDNGQDSREYPWWDEQDGTDLGAQFAIGVLYPLRKLFFLDLSLAYHLVDISQKYGAVAYWGQPARHQPGAPEDRASQLIDEAEGRVDFLQLRLGLRYGR